MTAACRQSLASDLTPQLAAILDGWHNRVLRLWAVTKLTSIRHLSFMRLR